MLCYFQIGSWSQIDKKFVGLNNGRGRGHDDIVKKRVKVVTTILVDNILNSLTFMAAFLVC